MSPSDALSLADQLIDRWPDPPPPKLSWRNAGEDRRGAVVAEILNLPAATPGPLRGLRLAVKDNIAVAGAPMSLGAGVPGFIPIADAEVVARARGAGATVTCKAQCEAFLLGANSFSSRPLPVRNPVDPDRSAGGSSSGSAALVAAGEADIAFGSDSGGSVRIPAAFCGVVGFKPSRGRLPATGMAPLEPWLETVGILASTVAQAHALFGEIDGPDRCDPRQIVVRTMRPRRANRAIRLGVPFRLLDDVEPPVRRALDMALTQLRDCGLDVVEWPLPELEELNSLHLAIYAIGHALTADTEGGAGPLALTPPAGWAAWRRGLPSGAVPPLLDELLGFGRRLHQLDPGLYGRALRRGEVLARSIDERFGSVDVLALPVTAGLAPLIPAELPADADAVFGDTRFTAPFNVTGHPALALPTGRAQGLPVGLQLVAPIGSDTALLECAAHLEKVLQLHTATAAAL